MSNSPPLIVDQFEYASVSNLLCPLLSRFISIPLFASLIYMWTLFIICKCDVIHKTGSTQHIAMLIYQTRYWNRRCQRSSWRQAAAADLDYGDDFDAE